MGSQKACGEHQTNSLQIEAAAVAVVDAKLKNLPQGWTFETRVLSQNLALDTGRAGVWAAIIRDDLHCTYQACGYGKDTSANYVP